MKAKIILPRRCSGTDMDADMDAAIHSLRSRRRARLGEEIKLREADDGRVGITALSPTEWLVCDPTIANGDPSGLLGFIQLVGDSYEVTHLGRVNDRSNYSSFNRAAASLVREAFTSAPSPDHK